MSDAMAQSFRTLIQRRIKELGWTPYRLAVGCQAKGVHRDTVFRFLRGERDVTSERMMVMLEVLGLKVAKGTKPKKLPRSGDATA